MWTKVLLCTALLAFSLTGQQAAHAQQPQFKRTELQKVAVPGTKYNAVLVLVEVPANFTVDRHTHPGIETGMVLEGEADFIIEGRPDRRMKAGDHFEIGEATPHS